MRYLFGIVGVLALILSFLVPVAGPVGLMSVAQAQVVSGIVVEGNQRVETDTVLSYMQISAGEPYDSGKVDESVKALFQTGLFAGVQIFRRRTQLVVKVADNPSVNQGNF